MELDIVQQSTIEPPQTYDIYTECVESHVQFSKSNYKWNWIMNNFTDWAWLVSAACGRFIHPLLPTNSLSKLLYNVNGFILLQLLRAIFFRSKWCKCYLQGMFQCYPPDYSKVFCFCFVAWWKWFVSFWFYHFIIVRRSFLCSALVRAYSLRFTFGSGC